ncbi:hypothetical protein ACQJBY_007948 [Aegilops geniculata]
MYLSCIQLCKAIPCFSYKIGSSQVANIPFYPRSSIQRRHQRRHCRAKAPSLDKQKLCPPPPPLSSFPMQPLLWTSKSSGRHGCQ